jgi:tRNA uridine 5-carboxymethylaminomethyl modification enzyme
MRLTEQGYNLGLVTAERYALLLEKKICCDNLIAFANEYHIKPQYVNEGLEALGTTALRHGVKLVDLILRPQLSIELLATLVPALQEELDKLPATRKDEITEAVEIIIKYGGYIKREQMIAEKIGRLENIKLKGRFDYTTVNSLSTEARQKLAKIDPETIAQASRIPGISPSDINILLVLMGR